MLTAEELKPVDVSECTLQTAEMDFLIAQKMMYQVTTIVWPEKYDGAESETTQKVYEMTLSDLLEHFVQNLNKDSENIVSIKPI